MIATLWILVQQTPPGRTIPNCRALNVLDCLQQDIMTLADTWLTGSLKVMAVLFSALVVLEIIVTGYSLWMKRDSAAAMVQNLGFKLVVMAAILAGFSWLATSGGGLIPIETMEKWGESMAPPSPRLQRAGDSTVTALVGVGLAMFFELGFGGAKCTDGSGFGDIVCHGRYFLEQSAGNVLLNLLASLLILGTFIKMAAELLAVLIEGYIVMGAGAVFLGFMAFRGTAPLSEGWVRYMVVVCLKTFFVFVLASFVVAVGQDMLLAVRHASTLMILPAVGSGHVVDFTPTLAVVAVCMIMWGLSSVPEQAAQMISENITFNIKGWLSKT